MCEISEAFGPRWGHDPIRHIYTITGREVRSVMELFRQQKLFIATGAQRLFGPSPVPGWNNLSKEAAISSRGDIGKEVPFTGVQIRVRPNLTTSRFTLFSLAVKSSKLLQPELYVTLLL